jgi:hypothetical protein
VLQGTPEGLLAFRATWTPQAGTLEVDANPSFTLKGAGETDIPPLYWDGGSRIYLFTEHGGKAAVTSHGPTPQASVVQHTGLPPEAVAPVFYASNDRQYVGYGVGNKLGIVEMGPGGVKKQLFSAPEATGEVVPLFLAKREDRLVVLAVLNRPTAAEELFLVRIDAAGKATWVPVARKGEPQCSFIAGAGVKVGLCGQRLYLESPCGEEIQSLSLDEEKPRLVRGADGAGHLGRDGRGEGASAVRRTFSSVWEAKGNAGRAIGLRKIKAPLSGQRKQLAFRGSQESPYAFRKSSLLIPACAQIRRIVETFGAGGTGHPGKVE